MTTIVAVKKGKRLCLGTDSLAIFGSRKEEGGKHVHEEGKFITIGPNIIGISGHPSWRLVLKHYFSKQRVSLWKEPDQIFDLFNEMHEELKKKYCLSPPSLNYLPFVSSELQLLIINECGIFEVEYSRTVRQYNHYSAIGSGEEYALGAIQAVYEIIEDAEEIAKIALESAAQFDRKTGLPLYTHCIDLI